MSEKSKKNKKQLTDYKKAIIVFLKETKNTVFRFPEVLKKLRITSPINKKFCAEVMEELVKKRKLRKIDNNTYSNKESNRTVLGKVDMVAEDFAYIIHGIAGMSDICVDGKNLKSAIHGDIVRVQITSQGKNKLYGKISEVVERSKKLRIVVTSLHNNEVYGLPAERNLFKKVLLTGAETGAITDGLKVAVAISGWSNRENIPIGQIVSILGKSGEHETEIHSIMTEYGLNESFNEEIDNLANEFSSDFTKKDLEGRRDFRDITTFTIDPIDAKDFDDALSIKKIDDKHFEIGIHIADVSHYVLENSALDKEAYNRGCSVYLVDRTVPMLPEVLSNNLCSLIPHKDRLAFSVIVEIDINAEIKRVSFSKTIIRSKCRFTYEDAQKTLDNKEGVFFEELNLLNTISKQLKERRLNDGAIEFENNEIKFVLDSKNAPVDIAHKKILETNELIEEFMVLANNKVAEFLVANKGEHSGAVFRTHGFPEAERLADFYLFCSQFAQLNKPDKKHSIPEQINSIIYSAKHTPYESIINKLAIRTMAKAVYSSKCAPHFGLGIKHYSHFTSPIRRYPDIITHRALNAFLTKKKSKNDIAILEYKCLHLSDREQIASAAERASIKYKQVEFATSLLGHQFDGVISGLSEKAIYVEFLNGRCEGTLTLSTIKPGNFSHDKNKFLIKDNVSGKTYKMGDHLKITIHSCDILSRSIQLKLN